MIATNIHASCVVCGSAGLAFGAPADAGVLIVGESGSGKSDLALRLIGMGARLVADDRCELFVDGTALCARVPRAIEGRIEVRGLGIVALPFVREARIALVVCAMAAEAVERLPEHRTFTPPGLSIAPEQCPPQIELTASAASAAVKVLAAVAAFEMGLFRENIPE